MKTKIFLLLLLSSQLKSQTFFEKFITQAIAQTKIQVTYDPAYTQIKYPNGDVAANKGVCTDVIIRSYRGVGIDLQKEVHEDMQKHFSEYPKYWKLKKTDTNIDHRRVPNLMVFFKRQGAALTISQKPEDYKPGDLVTWNLQGKNTPGGITHIGIVINQKSEDGKRCMIVHNIGGGNKMDDVLFDYVIIGHYRYQR